MKKICKEIDEYIELVRSGKYPVCKDQIALCDMVEKCFENEDIYVDEKQLSRYLDGQKYFNFNLFEWQKFVFALHNCTYWADGSVRWPILLAEVARGAGKNGYLAFDAFSLITPVNNISNYHIDIFATSEDQARTSFDDVHEILESNKTQLEKYFYWNMECITNLKTGSKIKYRTSNVKTKDGGRPGMVAFDEYHAYENNKLPNVAISGLGKKKHPRQIIITTNGDVRGGPLDDYINQAEQILHGGIADNGILPFICRLDDKSEVDNPLMWHKANPSLRYFPDLQKQLMLEYAQYKINPTANSAFMVKRMNLPMSSDEADVTEWENIKACNRELPELDGCDCIGAIDYANTNDFVSAGLLFKYNQQLIWMTHTWVCESSKDLHRIKAPLKEWEEKGLLTFVKGPEISPDVPANWLVEKAKKYNIKSLGIDSFRYTLLKKALTEADFDTDKNGANNILLTKRVTVMRYAPVILSAFNNKQVIYGNNPLMNWYINNSCISADKDGNITFQKKEAKSRKTDGFFAFISAVCSSENLTDSAESQSNIDDFEIYSY